MIKLRQGFGRLIRSSTDRGMMIVLDERMDQAKYASKIKRAFPPELVIKSGNLRELKQALADFFNHEKK